MPPGQPPVQDPVQNPQRPPTQNFGKELANLVKLYSNNSKYSNKDDNLDYKLMIFYDLCQKASVPLQAFDQAYSTMLRGLALDHYYTNTDQCLILQYNTLQQALLLWWPNDRHRHRSI